MKFSASLSHVADTRDNNFNLMRLGAAIAVVLSHSFILSYNEPNSIPRGLGYLAVNCFFIMSGFLVCKSLLAHSRVRDFYRARVLRIYPALFCAALFCVFIVGPLNTTLPLFDYFTDSNTYRYLLKNSTLVFGIDYYLPSVFTNTGSIQTVNAPLWTLFFEIYLYLLIGLLGFFFIKQENNTVFSVAVIALSSLALGLYIYSITAEQFEPKLANNSVRFAALFGIGATFYLARKFIKLTPWVLLALILALVISIKLPAFHKAVLYPILAYVLLYLAYVPKGVLLKFNAMGDYSYGVYIFAYPIQQWLVTLWPNISTPTLFFSSGAASLLLAVFSWHIVERKALSLKK